MTAKKQETEPTTPVQENNDCFIIMPIADHADYKQGHFKRVYEDIFKPACISAGYRPVRADDTKQANLIQLDILQKLLESPMAICDLSTRNPNVLFELGLRQAFDKPTILVQEEGTPRIFDINLFRYVEYRNGLDYRDVLVDQKSIEDALVETKQAVADGKSVNSIIKLLSITNPASLQDASNFGDKEYFQILMSEIRGVKDYVKESIDIRNFKTAKPPQNKLDFSINNNEFFHIEIDKKTTEIDFENFYSSLVYQGHLLEIYRVNNLVNYQITFKTSNSFFGLEEINKLANQFKVIIAKITRSELPF